MRRILLCLFCLVGFCVKSEAACDTAKPWTLWWIMGSSMTEADISTQLSMMSKAGIGGVNITPIYGERGDEENYIPFLSERWLSMLKHICAEADRMGMGVDMSLGTGWPFGGPEITPPYAAKCLNANGECILTGQKVKRAAPGGEGAVMDPFSRSASDFYFEQFKKAAMNCGGKLPVRGFYNDSYEIYNANWTADFKARFKDLRGYDIASYMYVLSAGEKSTAGSDWRIWQDYHETISDMLLEGMVGGFADFSKSMGVLSRNQAHGSPGNILDLYAACDIPECESFGANEFKIPYLQIDKDYNAASFGRPDPLFMKFASSAANFYGKPLVSAEACTWLGEHFKVSLAQIKPQLDQLWTCGINHIFYHGTTYSPLAKAFPGRLFYASVNFNYNAPFWDELPKLNAYVKNVQELLQNSKSDNDVLLYFPVHAFWKSAGSKALVLQFSIHGAGSVWSRAPDFYKTAELLERGGYSFDYVSDRMLKALSCDRAMLKSGGASYKVVVFPTVEELPYETFKTLDLIIKSGANVIFAGGIPKDVTGLYDFQKRRSDARGYAKDWRSHPNVFENNLPDALKALGIRKEAFADFSLRFIRKKNADGFVYFISNLDGIFKEGDLSVRADCASLEYFNPLTLERGALDLRDECGRKIFRLSLLPGESCLLFAKNQKSVSASTVVFSKDGSETLINSGWKIRFVKGRGALPSAAEIDSLSDWTRLGDESAKYFSGVAVYAAEFRLDKPETDYVLDLGDVRDSCEVFINGISIGKSWCLPNRLKVARGVLRHSNTIEVFVRNSDFNAIIKLDKEKTLWKNFRDINFVDIKYKAFDASNAKPVKSGLLGPVKLIRQI